MQAQVPDAPVNLANDASITRSTQIGLTWDEGFFNGASVVIDYKILMHDDATATWVTFAESITQTTYTATGLTADQTYLFKV